MYSRVNGYNGYNNYKPVTLSPVTNRPYTQNGRPNTTTESIFASGMNGNRSVGDTVELSGARRAEAVDSMDEMDEMDPMDEMNGNEPMNGSSETDDSPIGEVELSEEDYKVLEAAMEAADVPESMMPVAKEHLAAMNESGNTNNNSTNNTTNKTNNTNTANQDKINKLAEFVKNYYEQFGDEGGEVSKSEYLKNVSQMMKADMEEQGKPYIDPSSGVFDPKSSNFYDTTGDDYVNVARAAKEISNDSKYKGNDYTKGTDALGNNLSDTDTGNESDTDSVQNFQDFMIKNQDNARYTRLSAVERQNKMYQDYKYNLI
ncbi:MAG TPA: hypothetical protein DDW90_10775 [Cyanobacteria bacterium UBA9971]|nr:hypothetical protein [Cyanobacteria bacterium UBA9971]